MLIFRLTIFVFTDVLATRAAYGHVRSLTATLSNLNVHFGGTSQLDSGKFDQLKSKQM